MTEYCEQRGLRISVFCIAEKAVCVPGGEGGSSWLRNPDDTYSGMFRVRRTGDVVFIDVKKKRIQEKNEIECLSLRGVPQDHPGVIVVDEDSNTAYRVGFHEYFEK